MSGFRKLVEPEVSYLFSLIYKRELKLSLYLHLDVSLRHHEDDRCGCLYS